MCYAGNIVRGIMIRLITLLTGLLLLIGCAEQDLSKEPPVDLGDFKLGHNVVVASKMVKGPVSPGCERRRMDFGPDNGR